MDYQIEDFIGVFENAMPDTLCQRTIRHFNFMEEAGLTLSRQAVEKNGKSKKDDRTFFISEDEHSDRQVANATILRELNEVFYRCLGIYGNHYDTLTAPLIFLRHRIQRTRKGQGYHIFHHERGVKDSLTREIAALAYLNDVESGGELEFLYYARRIKPKKGTVILFPAGFTHTHKGNMVLEGEKYVVATWALDPNA